MEKSTKQQRIAVYRQFLKVWWECIWWNDELILNVMAWLVLIWLIGVLVGLYRIIDILI